MANNSLKYATQQDLQDVFSDCYKYASLVQLTGDFVAGVSNAGLGFTTWFYYGIAEPSKIFSNSIALAKTDPFTAQNQYQYDDTNDKLTLALPIGDSPKEECIIEVGKDSSTMISDALVLASEELNAKIDNRYPRPLPMTRVTHSTDLEYESIVKRVTCLIAAKNMIRAKDPSNQDALIYEQEANEIIEGLNNGSIKLVWENDATEIGYFEANSGNTGTITLDSVMGSWVGRTYDIIEIEALGAGGLGAVEVSVKFGNSDAIGNDGGTTYTYKPSGSYDHIGSGLMIRFSQVDATGAFVSGDKWLIPVKNTETSGGITSSNVRSVKAVRNR